MAPTLLPGDNVSIKITPKNYTFDRGEIVEFSHYDYYLGNDTYYLSRVIAESGDAVSIQKDKILVNGKQITSSFDSNFNLEGKIYDLYFEENSKSKYNILHKQNVSTHLGYKNFIVPSGKVFCMLDGRWAYESNNTGVIVDKSNIVGYVNKVLFSWEHESNAFRKSRFGLKVDSH